MGDEVVGGGYLLINVTAASNWVIESSSPSQQINKDPDRTWDVGVRTGTTGQFQVFARCRDSSAAD